MCQCAVPSVLILVSIRDPRHLFSIGRHSYCQHGRAAYLYISCMFQPQASCTWPEANSQARLPAMRQVEPPAWSCVSIPWWTCPCVVESYAPLRTKRKVHGRFKVTRATFRRPFAAFLCEPRDGIGQQATLAHHPGQSNARLHKSVEL